MESKKLETPWDAKVMEAMKSIGVVEDSEAKGLMQVAADVCDSLVVSNVIYSRYEEAAGGTISFTDIFNQVIIGVREQNQNRRFVRGELRPVQLDENSGLVSYPELLKGLKFYKSMKSILRLVEKGYIEAPIPIRQEGKRGTSNFFTARTAHQIRRLDELRDSGETLKDAASIMSQMLITSPPLDT